jgi:hypothetical protein
MYMRIVGLLVSLGVACIANAGQYQLDTGYPSGGTMVNAVETFNYPTGPQGGGIEVERPEKSQRILEQWVSVGRPRVEIHIGEILVFIKLSRGEHPEWTIGVNTP